ncbi:SpoIIE family protein phosphatase [Spirosoma taeanense]|uniref:SpoIIE family protein phosphatase n=1 Tax=Spirosoma taeanense TaxID=2735870 RepID=A0A6M5Y8S1_9BACT|nr:protein phosphatase 2C domain-containing protein [Spirosoma taeanense]QJW90329.1 SpoIIE family protein phosphatase [Spirosoma taeanense]
MTSMLIAGQTDVGQRRRDNQDTFISKSLWTEHSALLVVIDGVGGYAGGEQAAAIARSSIERYMTTPTGDTLTMLREAVVHANNQIAEQRQQDPKLAQMCCVLTAAVADTETRRVLFVHVGDTRLYRFRPDETQGDPLKKLTRDHSLVGVREDANQLTEAEAMRHPRRNEILREVGSAIRRIDDPEFLESGETDFLPGDTLLLCSDGLTDMLTRAQLLAVLTQSIPVEEQITELIRQANEQGGHDNITVVLARNNTESDPVISTKAASKPAKATPPTPVASNDPGTALLASKPSVPAPKGRAGIWAGVLSLVIVIAALLWYQNQEPERSVIQPDSLAAPQPAAAVPVPDNGQEQLLDSLLRQAYESAGHELTWPTDTLRLTRSLVMHDSLRALVGSNDQKPVVIVAADTTQPDAAFRVAGTQTMRLENVQITGFETGIETGASEQLELRNVFFTDVEAPIQVVIRQDTFRNASIQLNVIHKPDSSRKR